MADDVRGCKRHVIHHNSEKIYLIYGADFMDIKFPYENRPENRALRDFASIISEKVTELKQNHIYEKTMEEEDDK